MHSDEFMEEMSRDIKKMSLELSAIKEDLIGKSKPYLTVKEFAREVGRAAYTVRTWIKNGLIEADRIFGTGPKGRYLIRREELDKLI